LDGGTANEVSTPYGTFQPFDAFSVSGQGWHVTRLWSNNAMRISGVTQASWEIHSGADPSGAIVASGVDAATQTTTGSYVGLDSSNWSEYSVSVGGLDLYLAPGTYCLSVCPLVGEDPGTDGYLDSYSAITTGVNCIGQQVANNGTVYSMGIAG